MVDLKTLEAMLDGYINAHPVQFFINVLAVLAFLKPECSHKSKP